MSLQELQNADAEKAVIRLILSDAKLMQDIAGHIEAKDFYSASHQTIFAALTDLYAAGDDINMATLTRHLDKAGTLQNVGGITYITALFNGIADYKGLKTYVEVIKEFSERRYIYKLAENLKARIQDRTQDIGELKGRAVELIAKNDTAEDPSDADELIEAFDSIVTDTPMGLMTDYKGLDIPLQGLKKGEFIVLAGRPSMGKTAFALNIVANVCEKGHSVLFYSLEMKPQQLYQRLIFWAAQTSQQAISRQKKEDARNASLYGPTKESKAFWQRVHKSLDAVQNWPLKIIKANTSNFNDMRLRVKAYAQRNNVDLLVIDYLQLLSAEGFKTNRNGEISYITRELKNLAEQLDIPILVLSQLSRAVESRNDKRPIMADLRDSGSIEQDADVILAMYRDRYYNPEGDEWTEVLIRKNRQGSQGAAMFEFKAEIYRFEPYEQFGGKEIKNADIEGIFKG